MTDHLKAAHVAATSAAHAPDAGGALSWLTTACEHIIAHLEAQEALPQAASAPQAAQEAESGQGDGGEAERAAARAFWLASNFGDEAWAVAAWDDMGGPEPTDERAEVEVAMRAAIAAAEPHIRAKVAAEIADSDSFIEELLDIAASLRERGGGFAAFAHRIVGAIERAGLSHLDREQP